MLYYCKTKLGRSQPTSTSQQQNDAPEANCDHHVHPQFASELAARNPIDEVSAAQAEAGSESSAIIDIGRELRQAREHFAWSLAECAAYLRIRSSQLAALEEGRLAALPGLTYALGFLRAYATALGLDADGLVRRFRAAAGRSVVPPALVFPTPQPTRGAPAGALALLGLVLAVGVYVAWYRLSAEGRLPAEVVPPVPERLASLAEQAVPPRPPSPAPAPTAVTPPAVVPPPPPASFASLPEVPPTSAAAATPPAPPLASNAPAENDGRILLRARSDAWIQVREKDGPILLTRILRPGETWPVPDKAGLLLTTGNAGGTELVVDGVVAPLLGGNGAVRRDQPLDPDLIKEGKLPAQLQAASLAQGGRPVTP